MDDLYPRASLKELHNMVELKFVVVLVFSYLITSDLLLHYLL